MEDLARMQEALRQPVLGPSDLPGYTYAPDEVPREKGT
jgi:hypothetical protein